MYTRTASTRSPRALQTHCASVRSSPSPGQVWEAARQTLAAPRKQAAAAVAAAESRGLLLREQAGRRAAELQGLLAAEAGWAAEHAQRLVGGGCGG